MKNYSIEQESKDIIRQFSRKNKGVELLCPILKVLEMRHSDLNKIEAREIVCKVLEI